MENKSTHNSEKIVPVSVILSYITVLSFHLTMTFVKIELLCEIGLGITICFVQSKKS